MVEADRSHGWQRLALTLLAGTALALCGRACLLSLDPAFATHEGGLYWLNFAPILLLLTLVWAVTGKTLFAGWVGVWSMCLLFAANAEKLEHLDQSLRPDDFWILPSLLGSPAVMLRYLDNAGGTLWTLVAVVLVAVLLLALEPTSFRTSWIVRLLVAGVCAWALWTLLATTRWEARCNAVFSDHFSLWQPEAGIRSDGLIAGLLRLTWAANTGPIKPDDSAVAAFVRDNTPSIVGRGLRARPQKLADVVVIQSESLFDPADLQGFEPSASLPEFRRLTKKGLSGKLAVPTFAGGTIRTEYEFLSGYPLDAFPAVHYPYLGMGMKTPTSLANSLREAGYTTAFVHPHERDFYNRDKAMAALGFQSLAFYDDFKGAPTHGWYTTDAALFERIESLMPTHGPPMFVMGVTMENHGPWSLKRGLSEQERAEHILPDSGGPETQDELREYLTLLASGDRALGAFAERLLRRERPTLLLVYGDHLPDLPHTYQSYAFDNALEASEQTVPYVLVGNVGYPQASLDTESEFLASLILDALQVPYSGYFALNAVARDSLSFGQLSAADRAHVKNVLRAAAQLNYVTRGAQPVVPSPGGQPSATATH